MPIKTWIGTTSASNVASNWSPAALPTAADDLIFNNSANCALLANINVKSVNFTGYTGTLSGASSITVNGSDTGTATGNSFVFSTGMTQSWTGTLIFTSTFGGYITLNGKALSGVTFNSGGGVWSVQDAMQVNGNLLVTAANLLAFYGNLTVTGTLTHTLGTVGVYNGSHVTLGVYASSNSNGRSLYMGSGNWTLTSTGTVWTIATSTNMNLYSEQSRIVINNTSSASSITFSGGNLSYYTLEIARGSSTAATLIGGNNTFVNFIDNTSTAAHTIQFTSPGTNSIYRFFVKGTAGNLVTVTRGISAVYTLQKLGREYVFNTDYITAAAGTSWTFSPSNTWYIGPNSSTGTTVGAIASNPPTAQSLLGCGGVG